MNGVKGKHKKWQTLKKRNAGYTSLTVCYTLRILRPMLNFDQPLGLADHFHTHTHTLSLSSGVRSVRKTARARSRRQVLISDRSPLATRAPPTCTARHNANSCAHWQVAALSAAAVAAAAAASAAAAVGKTPRLLVLLYPRCRCASLMPAAGDIAPRTSRIGPSTR